jgi:hypothetical protein
MAFMPESVTRAIKNMSGRDAEAVSSLVQRQERRIAQFKEQEAAAESLPGQILTDAPIVLGTIIRGGGERLAARWGFDKEYRQAVPFLIGGAYTGATAMGWSVPRQIALGAALPDAYEISRGEQARKSHANEILADELAALKEAA